MHNRSPILLLFFSLFLLLLLVTPLVKGQTLTREEMIFYTREWDGPRFPDGRPKVSEDILERMKLVTHEEAWSVLKGENYTQQYVDGWLSIHPDSTLVGRASTALFMPGRPDVHRAINEKGHEEGREKSQNSWPIHELIEGDVYVVSHYGKKENGPTVGDNLANAIHAKTKRGIIYDGAIRDIEGMKEIEGFTSFVRSYHPSHHLNNPEGDLNTTLMGINTPVRIGEVMVIPGDVVLGKEGGVTFIPAHLAEKVVKTSEIIRLRDMFGHQRLREGVYSAGQIDSRWSDEIERDFSQWLNDHMNELPVPREQIQELLENRTW